MPQPFLGFLLQSLPLTGIAHPSRGHLCSLAVIDQRAETPSSGPCYPWFPRPPRSRAVAWFPQRLWVPFSRSRENASRSPWVRITELVSFRQLHPLRSLVPPVSPFAPNPSCPVPAVVTLLGSYPSGAFPPTPWALWPAQTTRIWTCPRPKTQARLKGPLSPSRRVRPFQIQKHLETTSSTDSSPLRDWPAPPLDGAPTPLVLELRASPSPLTFEVS